jgi:uncharacterized membrane protein YkvI
MYPIWIGLALTILAFTFLGRTIVKRALTVWTLLLMLSLVLLIFYTTPLATSPLSIYSQPVDWAGASLSGLQFAVYNSALIPVLMYAASEITNPSQAIKSGFIAGIFGIIPALLLHLGFMRFYPAINNAPVPTYYLVGQLNQTGAVYLYFLVLIGTILLTAVGVLQGVNDRIDAWLTETRQRTLSSQGRACCALSITIISLLLSQLGLVDLIARGYGALSWGFMIVFTLPLLTIGTKRLLTKG